MAGVHGHIEDPGKERAPQGLKDFASPSFNAPEEGEGMQVND